MQYNLHTTVNYHIMEVGNGSVAQLQGLAEHYAPGLLLTILTLVVVATFASRLGASQQPPSLSDPIPFVFNTLQFMLDNEKFMERAK
jgi:hypothetical protein